MRNSRQLTLYCAGLLFTCKRPRISMYFLCPELNVAFSALQFLPWGQSQMSNTTPHSERPAPETLEHTFPCIECHHSIHYVCLQICRNLFKNRRFLQHAGATVSIARRGLRLSSPAAPKRPPPHCLLVALAAQSSSHHVGCGKGSHSGTPLLAGSARPWEFSNSRRKSIGFKITPLCLYLSICYKIWGYLLDL